MAIIKTQAEVELIGVTAVAGGAQSKSAELNTADLDAIAIGIYHTPDGTGTPTKGTEYRIETSALAVGDEGWVVLQPFVTGLAAATMYDADAVEPIGEVVIAESATAGLAVDQIVFFDTPAGGTLADSQWRRVVALAANTSFTIGDGLKMATAIGDDIWNMCEIFRAEVSGNWRRLRVICNNNYQAGTTININWKCLAVTNNWR
jgi:hypothetical protein